MTQSTQTALSTPAMQKVIDQAELKMIQPSVIVNSLDEPATPSKGSTFFRLDVKAFRPWTFVDPI